MNLGSRFNKVKQTADRLFLRGDKTDVVGELRDAEEKADELRILGEAFYRSVEKRLNTHHVNDEKKHKKVPENQVAETLKEALREALLIQTNDVPERTLFRSVVEEVIGAEQLMGKIVLDYEEQVEAEILCPLHKLLKEDFPNIAKQKKALKQAGLDVDSAKSRLRNSQSNPGQASKLEMHRGELEETETKLEQIRDSYACDLFNTLGRQREVARLSCVNLEMKLDFLQKSLTNLNAQLPPIRKVLEDSSCGATYAVSLHDHLKITNREIALPIEACSRHLIEIGLKEEGLFRVAGSASKIKRLRGAFDAGLINTESLASPEYTRYYDIHVVAGVFKCYLRDLPEPLLTHIRHDQWIEAARKTDHNERLRALWQVVNSLPAPNLENLRYLMKFLSLVAKYSCDNKMTSANLAIVIAPNLIWSQREIDNKDLMALGLNMNLTNDYRAAVEQMIEYCDYFFKDDIDFGVQPKFSDRAPSPKIGRSNLTNGTLPPGSSATLGRTFSHRRTGSSDLNIGPGVVENSEGESPKQPHRMKKKPAPKPPTKGMFAGEDAMYTTTSTGNSPDLSRSHSPPGNFPSPAPRLHHTNSLRRPTVEPPHPPNPQLPVTKPPRPSPPQQVSDPDSEVKPVSGAIIGFEKLTKHFESDIDFIDDDESESSQELFAKGDKKGNPPIGFIMENFSNEDKINDAEVELRDTPAGTSVEFRKSLEGVLKHPQALPRHLVRPTVAGDAHSGVENCKENDSKGVFHIPSFPVPAQRVSKEAQEKCDAAPRSDRPAVPEKPSLMNKSIVAVDHSRPMIPEKPAILGNKVTASKTFCDSGSAGDVMTSDELSKEGQIVTGKEADCLPDSGPTEAGKRN